jgi:hypothetical protein
MKSSQVTVTDVATLLVAADNQTRTVYIHNRTNEVLFIGNSAVTTSNGLDIAKHSAPITIFVPFNETIFGIAESGKSIDVRILTPNPD